MMHALFALFVSLGAYGADAPPAARLDSEIFADLVSHADEPVDITSSNSEGCKKPCTVRSYLAHHFAQIAAEMDKIKKTPKKKFKETFGDAVTEKTMPSTGVRGSCTPAATGKTSACRLLLHFGFGETVWSEELMYSKDKTSGQIIKASLKAVGTP